MGVGMKLESQVCALELSKRLKELGVKQESQFYWRCGVDFKTQVLLRHDQVFKHEADYEGLASEEYPTKSYAAFTVAELGVMLPHWNGKLCYSNQLVNRWVCVYAAEHRDKFLQVEHTEVADTEADARAKMLIHLIENKLVKP